MKERYRKAQAREKRFLMSFDIPSVNRKATILLTVFILLNFADVITTLMAIKTGPGFVEFNPIASNLFRLNFFGFITALGLKYLTVIPFVYATFLGGAWSNQIRFRTVKVGALVALAAADLFYFAVVGSNVGNLVLFYFATLR